jgi:hypothetical protein
MIVAVVDTNILVRGAIAAHPNSASKSVVDANIAGSFACGGLTGQLESLGVSDLRSDRPNDP